MSVCCRAFTGVMLLLLPALLLEAADSSEEHHPPATEQLSVLLRSIVEQTVTRDLDAREAAKLNRLERRLDGVLQEVDVLQVAVNTLQHKVNVTDQPEPEPECEWSPRPLSEEQAPHQRPAVLACARSCLQLRNQGGTTHDGIYWFTGMPVPVLCDFSHDGGGWTLLLTAVSRAEWDLLSVLQRSERSPSLVDNYSILRYGDAIRDLGTGGRFAYRIEAQAEKSRQRWGGVWFAPKRYSFVDETGDQTEIRLVRKFDSWMYSNDGIEKRMPWLRASDDFTVLTTTSGEDPTGRWGTLVMNKVEIDEEWQPSPWIHVKAPHSGTVLYWMREEEL